MCPTHPVVTAWCRRFALATLALAAAAVTLPAQTPAPANGADEFRQQIPLGAITGDTATLRQRILSATSYRLTPGDTYELQIQIGNDPITTFPLVLQDDFALEVPYIGTIDVAGRLFSDVRRDLLQRIKALVPARFVSFVLSQPARFDVFIYGGVTNPGIYTMTPLSRVSDLITVASGPQVGSSLRRVELIREGGSTLLDLTRFSTHGDLEANPTLTPGDRVRVPRGQRRVVIGGAVPFPGKFDLLTDEGIADLIRFAGGTRGTADGVALSVLRTRDGTTEVLEPTAAEWASFRLWDGDRVAVSPALRPEQMVLVQGALFGQPVAGDQATELPTRQLVVLLPFRSGLTVLDLLDQMGGPTPLARPELGSVLRAATGTRVAVDVGRLWDTRNHGLDLPLEPGDQLHVPMQDLNVYVGGEVNVPNAVAYVPGQTIGDYLRAAGGLTDDGAPRFTVIDVNHGRSRGTLYTQPGPGSTILAQKHGWASTRQVIGEVAIVVGFATAVVNLIIRIITDF